MDERSHEEVPDEFIAGDWKFRWCGWREFPNQLPIMGLWSATPRDYAMNTTGLSEREVHATMRMWVSCTFGSVRQYGAFDTFDTTYSPGHGHVIYPWSTDAEKLAAKRDALRRLIISVKTGFGFGVRYGE